MNIAKIIDGISFELQFFYYDIRWIVRGIKHAYQRAIYGVDDSMYWNLGDVIVEIYIKWLTDLIANNSSYPMNYDSHDKWIADLTFHLEALKAAKANCTTAVESMVWLAEHNGSLWD